MGEISRHRYFEELKNWNNWRVAKVRVWKYIPRMNGPQCE